jgi:hypothetical protein
MQQRISDKNDRTLRASNQLITRSKLWLDIIMHAWQPSDFFTIKPSAKQSVCFFYPTGQNPPSIFIKETVTNLQQIKRKTVPNLKGLPSRHTSNSKETKFFNI